MWHFSIQTAFFLTAGLVSNQKLPFFKFAFVLVETVRCIESDVAESNIF